MVIHFDALAHCSWVACYNLIAEDKKGLTMEEREYLSNDEIIDAFHALWDCFPGMIAEKSAVFDQVIPGRVRGWMPVSGRADLCIHFAVFIPQEDEQVLFEG